MSDDTKAQLDKIRNSIKIFREEEARLAREVGESSLPQVARAQQEEVEGSALFDRMTAAELMDLYENNRDEWKRLLAAKEAFGLRKLLLAK